MPRALDLGPRQRGPPYKKGNGRAGGLIPSRARPSRHCRWSAAAAAAHATARSAAARTPPPRACPPPPRTPHREEPTGGGGPKRSGRRRRSSAVPLRRSNNRGRGEARPPASAGAGNRNPSPPPLPSPPLRGAGGDKRGSPARLTHRWLQAVWRPAAACLPRRPDAARARACSKPVMTVLLPNLMFMLALLGGLGWLHLTSLMIYHLAICSSSLDPWIPYHRSLGECNPASVELKPCKWR